jgi:hypothetical protein
MDLEYVRDRYGYYSSKTSEIVRQLGFAGIALAWLFKVDLGGRQAVPATLRLPVALIVLSLSLDLVQYIVGAITWAAFLKHKDQTIDDPKEVFKAPSQINWGTLFFFWAKVVVMVVAYFLLLKALFSIALA